MAKPEIGKNLINFQISESPDMELHGWQDWTQDSFDDNLVMRLLKKYYDLETIIGTKVGQGDLMSQIALSEEFVLISSKQIGLVGDVTLRDWLLDVTGKVTGLSQDYTRIRGGVIETEQIVSHAEREIPGTGSFIDLDAGLPGHDTFIKCGDFVQIDDDGGFGFGDPAASRLQFDPDTGYLLFQCLGNTDGEGMAIGSGGTGALINKKGIRLYYHDGVSSKVVFVAACEAFTLQGHNFVPGDFAVGNPDETNFMIFNSATGNLSITGALITGTGSSLDGQYLEALSVGTLAIGNTSITEAKIALLAVNNGHINDLSADKINAGTLTARTVQTAAANQRAVLSAVDNCLYFYDAGGNLAAAMGAPGKAAVWTSGTVAGAIVEASTRHECGGVAGISVTVDLVVDKTITVVGGIITAKT